MPRRRAYSLVEMLVVIATGTAMMGVALGLLHMLMRMEQDSLNEVSQQGELDRLADQFRRDVHAADRFAVPSAPGKEDSPPAWQLALEADHVVEYRAEQEELIRLERKGDQVLRGDSFLPPAGTTVSIDLVGEAAPGIVSLRIARDASQPPSSIGPGLRVDAELGKDRRFVKENEP